MPVTPTVMSQQPDQVTSVVNVGGLSVLKKYAAIWLMSMTSIYCVGRASRKDSCADFKTM
jgi:hypothetical protein